MRQLTLLGLLLISLASAQGAETAVPEAKALAKAIKSARPGDVIVMQDGEWKDAEIKFFAEGTQDKPITLRAQTPGKVKLTGKSSVRVGGSYLILDGLLFTEGFSDDAIALRGNHDAGSTHCRITNCAFVDFNPPTPPEENDNTQWISMYGSDNEVDHCYFKGKNTHGPMFVVWVETQPNNHHIHHNYFAGRPALGANGGETMRIGTSDVSMNVSRALVENNYFEYCNGEAEIISNKSCENVYRYNTFVECKGALVLRHGNRNTVESNWFFGRDVEGTGGVRIIGEDQRIYNNYFDSLAGKDFESSLPIVNGIPNSKPNEYFRVQRAIVAFNTFVNCTQNVTFGIGVGARNRAEPPMNCTFANNVIVAKESPIVKFQDQPLNTTWIANYFFGAETGVAEPGVRSVNPLMRKGEDSIFRPQRSSPLVKAAEGDFPFIVDDIEGRSRDVKKDVGCFQSTGEATRKPLTAQDVGPVWMKK
jgi:poly(beta-D-mannuronate) lyase